MIIITMNKNRKFLGTNRKKNIKGATLLEVLISVLILSFGFLGMSTLQVRAMKGSISSFQRSQAVIYTQYLMDVMRVDRENAKGGSYNAASICSPAALGGGSLAKNSLKEWLTSIQTNMGTNFDAPTCATVACDANYICTVRINWDDSKAGGLAEQVLEVRSRV